MVISCGNEGITSDLLVLPFYVFASHSRAAFSRKLIYINKANPCPSPSTTNYANLLCTHRIDKKVNITQLQCCWCPDLDVN